MAKYRYWLPENGMTCDDPYEVDSEERGPRYIAQDAAHDYHSKHDGWESSWPLKITVELQDGTQRTFEVERDSSPVFYAAEVTAVGKPDV